MSSPEDREALALALVQRQTAAAEKAARALEVMADATWLDARHALRRREVEAFEQAAEALATMARVLTVMERAGKEDRT